MTAAGCDARCVGGALRLALALIAWAVTGLAYDVRWTEDLAVSGWIDWAGREGPVHAELELHSTEENGRLELSWQEGGRAPATVTGTLNGRRVAAEAAAP